MSQMNGTKRVTAADVARSLGLSRATVGFVLNNTPGQTIPEPTRRRVIDEADRLGYRPHRAAQALASGHSRIVLLMLPDWPIEHSMRVHLDEAALVLDRAGYSLVTSTPHPGGQAAPLWETLRPDAVMGLVPFSSDTVNRIRASGVQHIIPEDETDAAESASALGFADGPRLQVEHLLTTGKTRLAFAGSTDVRLQDLVAARRLLAHDTLAQVGKSFAGDADVSAENVGQVLAAWVDGGVDGVVAYNDDVAALIAGAALRSGIRIPDTLAVIGHDDSPLASLFVPSLSSVRTDSAGLGRYLADLALSAITGSAAPAADPNLQAAVVHRESTAASAEHP